MAEQTKRQKERHKIVLDLVERWKTRLKLEHYTLQVTPYLVDMGKDQSGFRWAEVSMSDVSYQAHISYNPAIKFTDMRMSIIHELCHLLTDHLCHVTERLSSTGIFTDQGWKLFENEFRRAQELNTCHLEKVFSAIAQWSDKDLSVGYDDE